MSLDNMLDDLFGNMNGESKKKQKIEKAKQEHVKAKIKSTEMKISESECNDLIIALNYAINAIKNKDDVKKCLLDSTRYEYFLRWTKIREKFKKIKENKKNI